MYDRHTGLGVCIDERIVSPSSLSYIDGHLLISARRLDPRSAEPAGGGRGPEPERRLGRTRLAACIGIHLYCRPVYQPMSAQEHRSADWPYDRPVIGLIDCPFAFWHINQYIWRQSASISALTDNDIALHGRIYTRASIKDTGSYIYSTVCPVTRSVLARNELWPDLPDG